MTWILVFITSNKKENAKRYILKYSKSNFTIFRYIDKEVFRI